MKWMKLFKRPWILFAFLIIILGVVIFISRGISSDRGIETKTVQRMTVENTVNETGVVEPAREVALGFGVSGRVDEIPASTNTRVEAGDILASVVNASEYASVLSARAQLNAAEAELTRLLEGAAAEDERVAEADVRVAQASLVNARADLENTRDTQNQLVKNAREKLYSEGLEAYLTHGAYENSSNSYTPPTITGTYTSEESGEYRIELYRSNTQSGYSFRYSGLEGGIGEVSTIQPQPLGARGLYIEFPENFARGYNVEWEVPVPNTRSSTYIQRKGAYESALKTRKSALDKARTAVESAESNLELAKARGDQTTAPATNSAIRAQEAAIAQASASLEKAEATYADTRLVAPFKGLITEVSVDQGEFVSSGTPIISLVTDADYQITVDIPEVDISLIEIGDEAEVVFDAYDDTAFSAEVVAIAPRAEAKEGVTVVAVTLQLSVADDRIRSGLSSEITIHSERRENVLAVPARAIIERDGQTYVRIYTGEGDGVNALRLSEVETGLRGSDGFVEITDGLIEGDTVVVFLPEEIRSSVEIKEQD